LGKGEVEEGCQTVKYGFNGKWRARDRAYEKFDDALLHLLLLTLKELAQLLPRKQGPGRPPKLDPPKTAFLAAVREHYDMGYRELASSRYVKFLALRVHYTSIQKAIARLPKWFIEEAARHFAELVCESPIEVVADSTGFSLMSYEVRVCGLERTRVAQTVTLSACWDAEKRVFLAFETMKGSAHAVNTLLPMMRRIDLPIVKCFADPEFCSRENVQGLADLGIEPVIKPQNSARPTRGLRYPAWREHIIRFKNLGYERCEMRPDTESASRTREP
jgi:hypothetical protein